MALFTSLKYRNADSTKDLNSGLDYLVIPGVVEGLGAVAPGVGLHVTVNPFVAYSHDGMVAGSTSVETLVVAANQVNVVLLYVKYNELGVPVNPILSLLVLEEGVYNAHADKAYMVVLAKVDLPLGAVLVNPGDISFVERDDVTPVGRSQWRGTTTFALLPVPASPTNRTGDFYWVSDHLVLYFWNGAAWEAMNTGSYNTETTLMNNEVIEAQKRRNLEGTGILSGPRPGNGSFASNPEVVPLETPGVLDSIQIDAFTALINGNYVEAHGRTIALPPKPIVGTRYDMVFMEVYRSTIITPESQLYAIAAGGNYTLNQLDEQERIVWWQPGPLNNNWDLNEITSDTHAWRTLTYRFSTINGVPASALYYPNDPVVTALATNVDGVAFNAPTMGADTRVWMAVSGTPTDGRSWAIPLFVVKRTSTEDWTIADAVKIFRAGVRWVFPVYPVCDLSNSARRAIDTIATQEPTNFQNPNKVVFDKPSGFLTGLDFPIDAGVAANSIRFIRDGAKIRIRGYEDFFTLVNPDIDLGVAPLAGHIRQLVYLEMAITLYDDDQVTKPYCMTSPTHHPYVPSSLGGGPTCGQGWKRGFVQYEVKVVTPGAFIPINEEYEAMVAAGWTKGDLAAPAAHQFDDGGIWSKIIAITDDDRIHPYLTKWAIPIAWIHRRNSGAYNYNTNPNGTGVTRPDDRSVVTTIHPDDLVSWRHRVEISEGALQEDLKQNMDLLMKGQLRTKFSNKAWGSGTAGAVGGSRILQADAIGVVPGTFALRTGDSMRRIWSDAREFHIVAYSFNIHAPVPISNDYIDYTYTPLDHGLLTIKAPVGAHIVRMGLPTAYVDGDPLSGTFMDFFGPPLFTTRLLRDTANNPALGLLGQPSPAWGKVISTTLQDLPLIYCEPLGFADIAGCPWITSATDTAGHATEMTTLISADAPFAAGGIVTLSWWVHYDRSFVAGGNGYDVNHGLAEIPDVVHSVIKDPLGAQETVNVGTIYTVVRKTLIAAASATFTAADVTAANPSIPGVVTLVGLDLESLAYSSTPPAFVSATMTFAQTSITINFAAPYTGSVEVVIAYYTDQVDKWVEIGRGGKSVQALFSWYDGPELDLTGAPPSNLAMQFGSTIWTVPEIDGRHASYLAPQIWTKAVAGAGAPWTLVPTPYTSVGGVGYAYSNMLSMNPTAIAGVLRYNKIVLPFQTVLSSAATDYLLIHYTYTPYQGHSNKGGETPVTVGAGSIVPTLRKMLQGTIESNTDWYITQSGAASYFSGVLGMTGIPVNHLVPFQTSLTLANASRFADYNMTYLVKDKTNFYTSGLRSNYQGNQYLNAAAILRLPYPQHVLMVSGVATHLGVMDWELDPARAGVNAGVFSYAPGYFGSPMVDMAQVKYSQFVNGLTPLCARGYAKQEDLSFTITPDQYQTNGSTGTYKLDLPLAAPLPTYAWHAEIGSLFLAKACIKTTAGSFVARTMAQFVTEQELDRFAGIQLYSPALGRCWFDPTAAFFPIGAFPTMPANFLLTEPLAVTPSGSVFWTYIPGFGGGNKRVILCNCPGESMVWYQSSEKLTAPFISLSNLQVGAGDFYLQDTSVLLESQLEENYSRNSNPLSGNTDNLYKSSKFVDLITLPLSSYSKQLNMLDRNMAQGMTSLKGKVVAYPSSWWAGDLPLLESLFIGSQDLKGAGRGIYFGTQTKRLNMPVFIPGSGTPLSEALRVWPTVLNEQTSEPPESYPIMPGEDFFHASNKVNCPWDHGGPIAYVCMGLFIRPSADEYKNNLMLQVSGGPTGSDKIPDALALAPSVRVYTPTNIDGTALDAFIPKDSPILPSK